MCHTYHDLIITTLEIALLTFCISTSWDSDNLCNFLKITQLINGENGTPCTSHNQFSRSAMSDSLQPHELQHARPPCPSPIPKVYPNSCSLSQWCHPTVSSSVVPFFSHLQSFPASGSFQMSQLFASDGRSIRVSASTSVLPMNTQDWSPLGWTG